MGEEKRHHTRWRKKIRVTYSFSEEDESYQEIFTEDLSEFGLQILVTDRRLEPQQTVRLKLEFVYDSVPIVAFARVAYIKADNDRYSVGLEFINMNDFQKRRLKRGLEKVRQEFADEAKEEGYAQEED